LAATLEAALGRAAFGVGRALFATLAVRTDGRGSGALLGGGLAVTCGGGCSTECTGSGGGGSELDALATRGSSGFEEK